MADWLPAPSFFIGRSGRRWDNPMLLQLLGTLVTGVAVAGVVMLAFRLSGRPSPRWMLPASAGLAMFGFHLWNEYTWFQRTAAALPQDMRVAATYATPSPLQPWTLVVPRIERFAVIDPRAIRWNETARGLRMVEVFLIARYMPTLTTVQIFDCQVPRRADMTRDMGFDAEGQPVGAEWVPLEQDDRLRQSVCTVVL